MCKTFILLLVIMVSAALAANDDEIELMDRPNVGGDPLEVSFFVFVIDIDDIDGSLQNFTANVAIRLQWKDERLAKETEQLRMIPLEKAWNPRMLLANRQTFMRTSMPKVLEIEPDGTVHYRQRYVGPISQPMNLSKFPFDRHDFTIQFVAVGYSENDLKFIPGKSYYGDLKGGAMSEKLSLPDWEVEKYQAANHPYEPLPDLKLAGFDFTFTAKRHELYYIWQVIVPLVFIVIMSWGAFWINPEHAGAQIGVATSSMLTLIAYRFMLGELIPRLPYMTRMDYFTLASTILVFLTFIEVITTTILVYKGKRKIGISMDNISRFLFPAVFAGASVWSLLL